MKFRTIIVIGLSAFIVLCVLSIGIGVFFLTRIPAVETQVYPGSSPVHVMLSAPKNSIGWPLNSFIPLQADANGGGTISSIELYINGQLYEKISSPPGWNQPEFSASWNWQPGTPGVFILLAKSTNITGGTGISDPIRLEVINAAQSVSPYVTKEGDTLQSIAESEQVDVENLAQDNPSIAGIGQIIPVDTTIDIPNPADPVTNPKIIPGYLQLGIEILPPDDSNPPPDPGSEESSQPPPKPEEEPQGFHIATYQDLKFWLDQTGSGEKTSLPYEPTIKGHNTGCDVNLTLNYLVFEDSSDPTIDSTKRESGFFLYRSQDGKPFERIDTLPAITNSLAWPYRNGYKLKDQSGLVTFTLSSFNTSGETMSAPVTLQMDEADCRDFSSSSESLSEIYLDDGVLILPYSMNLAYMYISINDNQPFRLPEGDRMFLPESGVKLDLYDYFDTLLGSFTEPDFDISLEVWGWVGAELKFVGNYKTTIHRSVLLVCSQEGENACSGNGDGEWMTEINFSDQKPVKDQIYKFKWISSKISKTEEVCYQFAAGAFPDDTFWNMNELISSQCGYIIKNNQYAKSNEEIFTQSMGVLLYPTEAPEYTGWGAGSEVGTYNSNWFPSNYKEGSAFTIYARVLPKSEKYDYARFSNTVVLHNSTPPAPSSLPPLASPFPSMYEVEILEDTYFPPTFETEENWGCVIIDDDPTNPNNVGKTVCPPPLGIQDDCEGIPEALCLLQGLGDSILFVVDFFLYGFNMIKWEMTEVITSVIPYCHDYGPCYGAVKEAVEQIVYYGIGLPPNTNTSEDLFAGYIGGGIISSAAGYLPPEAGITAADIKKYCGADCQEKIGIEVLQGLRRKKSFESQKACSGAYEAYFHNKQAMCLDPSILVHPAEGSGNFPAGITIKVTRIALDQGQAPPPEENKKYNISVVVTGSNDNTAWGPGFSTQLYSPVVLPVYLLEAGDSMILNTSLFPCNSFGNKTCGEKYSWDGMRPVYFNGKSTIEATEMCYSPGSSWEWVPCSGGGYDVWTFDNPTFFENPAP